MPPQPINVLSPTEAEVASLTSLHPHFSESSTVAVNSVGGPNIPFPFRTFPPLNNLLEEVFHFCREDWVTDFLFKSDMSPLSVLTSPVNANSLSVAHVSTVSAEKPASPNGPSPTSYLFDARMAGEFLFVPAFSVGTTTAGFGAVHYSVLCRAEWGRDPSHASRRGECGHIRFVRNDATRSLIILFDDKKADIIKMDVFAQLSIAMRKRITLTMRRSKFYHMLHQQSFSNPVRAAHSTALMLSYHIERRICTMCTTYMPSRCACSRAPILPKNSLDFSSMRNNMDVHGGEFEGMSTTALFANGSVVISALVGHHLNSEGNKDRIISSRLGRWAIHDLLKDKTETPFMDYTLAIRMMAKYLYTTDADKTRDSNNYFDLRTRHDGVVMNGVPERQHGFNVINTLQGNGNGSDGDSNFFAEAEGTQAALAVNYDTSAGFYAYSPKKHVDSGFELPICETQEDGLLDGLSYAVRNETSLLQSQYECDSNELEMSTGFMTETPPILRNESQIMGRISVDMQSEGINMGTGTAKRLRQEKGSDYSLESGSTLRATASPTENGNGSGSGDGIDLGLSKCFRSDKERDQMMKAELRRKRNREAAQRSNLRRKIRNDTLKHELFTSHARAAQLRAQEQVLREENLKLRKLLSRLTT